MPHRMIQESGWVGTDKTGHSFEASIFADNNRALVRSFTVHKNGGALCGYEMWFTDNSRRVGGTLSGDAATINFAPGEKITYLGLYGNGVGTRCGGIQLNTDKGQTLKHVVNDKNNMYPRLLGSGLMAGIYGNIGSEFDCLGLLFVKPIQSLSITISDADWVNNPAGTGANITETTLDQAIFTNFGNANMDWAFDGTKAVTSSRTFTQASTITWGVNVQISAGLFGIGLQTQATWNQANVTSNASTYSQQFTVGSKIQGKLGEGKSILCTTVGLFGTLNLRYNSRVSILAEDGTALNFDEPGNFDDAVYSLFKTFAKPYDPSGSFGIESYSGQGVLPQPLAA